MAKDELSALVNPIDTKQIDVLQKRTDDNSILVDDIVNKVVSKYCQPLDDYMNYIREVLNEAEDGDKIPNAFLDDIALQLPIYMYFIGEAQEALGIREDVSRAIRQDVYNTAFNAAVGTIADKQANAELSSQSETVANIAFSRAYKKVKIRLDAASEMLQSVKKVMSRRMSEADLTRMDRS